MSIHDGRDEWASPDEGAAVSAELQRLAAKMAASGAPEELVGGLGPMRSRVRLRRALKQGAIGAGTLAVAGILAVGVSQAVGWDRGEPVVPGGTPTVTTAPTPSATPSPTPTASPEGATPSAGSTSIPTADPPTTVEPWEVTVQYEDGYLPPWWAPSAGVVCGMPVADLVSTATTLEMEVTGEMRPVDADADAWWLPVRITLAPGSDAPFVIGEPRLLWAQDGVLVDIGLGWREGNGIPLELEDTGEWSGDAYGSGETACLPDRSDPDPILGGPSFRHDREDGRFLVYAVTTFDFDGDGDVGLLLSDPIEVTVADGVATPKTP